ncbi:MAG: DUF763 domain-containing protein [Thermoguttaceae bacterium]|jgi:hypothetical protein|nr:DUF763 domain-containing protein [Thermoguttaceae bacterium]
MRRQLACLPLHSGKAPPWLFKRMAKLAGAVTMAIVEEFGPAEMLRRLSDPWWFQAFGCVLGFDWHSSGVTTVTCGALREAAKVCGPDLGILVAGGKGATSRKTPQEIGDAADRHAIAGGERLIYASRMSAKVDSAAVQDGFGIYHHSFFFTPEGQWCVVQQGMDEKNLWARRYHWMGDRVDDFVCEPHAAVEDVAGESASHHAGRHADRPQQQMLLNMVAEEAEENRRASAALVREPSDWLLDEVERLTEGPTLFAPARHPVLKLDVNEKRLKNILRNAHEQHPQSFEALLGLGGVGPATIRSLSLLAEIIFEAPPSHRDVTKRRNAALAGGTQIPGHEADPRRWADYSYAHGGKDGTPFPVDRETYDRNIVVLTDAVRRARLGENDKFNALRRLSKLGRHGTAGDGS